MTTSVAPTRPDAGLEEVATPTVRATARRVALWVVLGVLALVVAVLVAAVTAGGSGSRDPETLALDGVGADGAGALVEVLRDRGVDVVGADSLAETRSAVDDPAATTILLFDRDGILSPEQRRDLLGLADRLVVVQPDDTELADLAPGVVASSAVLEVLTADCPVAAVRKAGTVDARGTGYAIDDAGAAVGCLATTAGAFGLVQVETEGTEVTVLGVGAALTNGQITRAGNAALALNLLGADAALVWYIPTIDDIRAEGTRSIAELTPGWVTPLIVLLALVGVAAAVWRGRRVGPLVVENLPVIVRARETMEGRARLYERAGARFHALDALRVGTVARLASACGLPRTATVVEVVAAVAARTGREQAAVSALLLDRIPANDAELVQLSDELLRLETEVDRTSPATRQNGPHER
jgi:hypothetical protein